MQRRPVYADHQPQLAVLGRSGPDGFARICTFALLTIRQPLRDAVLDYPLVRRGDRAVRSLFGSKHEGLSFINRRAPALYERCEEAFELMDDEDAEASIVDALCDIPSIGPAKAGFITQMVYGLSGCIDSHNLNRFELPERTFRLNKTGVSASKRRAILQSYNAFCRKVGGARRLWDDWCCYVSGRDPVNYPTADFVSGLHLAPLKA